MMTHKLIGAALIVLACSGFGFYIAANHKKEVNYLQKLAAIIEFIEWELEYRLTPLPQVCSSIAEKTRLCFSGVFKNLADELTHQISPDVTTCMRNVLMMHKDIPEITRKYLEILGDSLGEYNVEGQLKSLAQLRKLLNKKLEELTNNQVQRLRCYQTLGVCAGAALAILFV